ncbi:MAG: AAA family ATPase [Bradyrhizobiaceae bacterium]|nr:AAA family ATPase [Bradyrhizobiaceae bacterium]
MTLTPGSTKAYFPGASALHIWRNRHAIPQQPWVIENLLPIGLTLAAGREKCGKSVLSLLSIAIPIATGTKALDRFTTNGGRVLYYGFEEGLSTVLSRLERLYTDDEELPPSNLHLYLGDALQEWEEDSVLELEKQIEAFGDVKAIFLDTLRFTMPSRFSNADPYQAEYEFSARLQSLALRHGISIVALHHLTKSMYNDRFDRIAGTGLSKAAEVLMVLEREGSDMFMNVRGRSLPTTRYRLQQDSETLQWYCADQSGSGTSIDSTASSEVDLSIDGVFQTDNVLRYNQVTARVVGHGFHESTALRWLKARVAEGLVRKLSDRRGYERVGLQESSGERPADELPSLGSPKGDGGGSGDVPTPQEVDVTAEG